MGGVFNQCIDKYLDELMQDTTSSRLKLLAAWDGLTVDTQIKILSRVKEIPHELKIKALDNQNDYIRFLVSHRFFSRVNSTQNDEDQMLFEKISNDRSILVK